MAPHTPHLDVVAMTQLQQGLGRAGGPEAEPKPLTNNDAPDGQVLCQYANERLGLQSPDLDGGCLGLDLLITTKLVA